MLSLFCSPPQPCNLYHGAHFLYELITFQFSSHPLLHLYPASIANTRRNTDVALPQTFVLIYTFPPTTPQYSGLESMRLKRYQETQRYFVIEHLTSPTKTVRSDYCHNLPASPYERLTQSVTQGSEATFIDLSRPRILQELYLMRWLKKKVNAH